MIVMKFGGSSLKDPESLRHIAEIIKSNSFSRRVVVLSAIGGITDKLIEATENALHDEHARNDSLEKISEIHEHLIQKAKICFRIEVLVLVSVGKPAGRHLDAREDLLGVALAACWYLRLGIAHSPRLVQRRGLAERRLVFVNDYRAFFSGFFLRLGRV